MPHDSQGQRVEVIVVGAGLSGLAAGRLLRERGVSTIVLEARDRVGGRTLTTHIGDPAVDLGGQFIGPGQDRVRHLALQFGVLIARVYCTGRKVLWLG